MINRVVPVSRLTRDPGLRTTGSRVSVATFTLAVDRQYASARSEHGAGSISCVVWRKAAENSYSFTNKGPLAGIGGRTQTRSCGNKNGQRTYVIEVVVDSFPLPESHKDREARSQNGGYAPQNNGSSHARDNNQGTSFQANDNAPNTNNAAPQGPFTDSGSAINISDDDLPF